MDYFRNFQFFFNHAISSKQPANRLKSGILNKQIENQVGVDQQVIAVLQLATMCMFPLRVCRVILNETTIAGKIKYASGYLTLFGDSNNNNNNNKTSLSWSLGEQSYQPLAAQPDPSKFSSSEDSHPCPTSVG